MDSEMENKESIEGTTTKTDDDDDDDDVNGVGGGGERQMSFDGGIHFRGTLVSGRLLNSRGFRDRGGQNISVDMHSQESFCDGAHNRYSERLTSSDIAKYGFTARWTTGRLGSLVISGG